MGTLRELPAQKLADLTQIDQRSHVALVATAERDGQAIDTARSGGLQTMGGIVLASNRRMLRLARQLGFALQPDPQDGAWRACSCA
jgi:hypothetical protein